MPSYKVALTTTFAPIIAFANLPVLYFHADIENFEGQALEFTFGDPNIASVELRVPAGASKTIENRAMVGVLYGRTVSGTASPTITIW